METHHMFFRNLIVSVIVLVTTTPAWSGDPAAVNSSRSYDLSKDKVLYCIGYAHLDTQWRWDFRTTIDRYIRDTLDRNFERFDQFPGYVFNFTGSVRYEMMEEFYPDKYAQLKEYIEQGKWCVSGSSVDEGDVNVPSAEATVRQVLYGNQYFRREFGKESVDFMLPDCFGFPASMPSIWAHCGLKGFSTQKLTWGSAVGIPFKVGVWEGPDGASIIAALDPGAYIGGIKGEVHTNPGWVKRVEDNGKNYGVWADFHYYGVGDQGGAPRAKDIRNYLASVNVKDGPITVALTASDQMFRDITPEQKEKLPKYKGDLLLTEHSAGTLTSQSYMKRWNRKNELLADAAERVAVAADWLGGASYPREKLYKSWIRLLANQMHDILPGTSIPRAYRYSWNDEIVASNGFAAVMTDSVGAMSRALDTSAQGRPVIVYNPVAINREDIVEATVSFPEGAPAVVKVIGPDGNEGPAQIIARDGNAISILFVAKVPSVGLAVYDVRPGKASRAADSPLRITERLLENERYRVSINDAGDVSSIVDKANGGREILAEPARLMFTYEKPRNWPAWNMDWADRQKAPIGAVDGPAKVRIVESGPVRVSLEIEREARNSVFIQRIRLGRGEAGQRVEFDCDIDWQAAECALRASFPLTVSNPKATYNWGMGTIDRGNNDPVKYEVPSHEWFDLTDASGEYGVSVLEDSKFGSDKPSDNHVRLTLLYTPGVRRGYLDQHSQDWGRHEILYGLYGHAGDWRTGKSEWQGRCLNQPLRGFEAPAHKGTLGRRFSLAKTSTPQVAIRAMKKAEEGDAFVVRLQELWGRSAENVAVTFATPIVEAHETDGQERRIADAQIESGGLRLSMTPYSPRTFVVRFGAPTAQARVSPPECTPVALEFDVDCVSSDADPADGAMGTRHTSLPAEMLPAKVSSEGITFEIGPTGLGQDNAVTCRGQKIELPPGDFNRTYVLAAAGEDTTGQFVVGDSPIDVGVQAWTGFVGQWDDRIWDKEAEEVDFRCEGHVTGFTPGFIKRDTIAWYCMHRHHQTNGNESYMFSYLYKYGLDLPEGARSITLPNNEQIRVFAITLARNDNDSVQLAHPLYDDFAGRGPLALRHEYLPEPSLPHEGRTPVGKVTIDRKQSFDSLSMGPPSGSDFADKHADNGVVFRYYDGDGQYIPNYAAGAEQDTLPRLNDSAVAKHHDDTERCVWYNTEGRFYTDLGRSIAIERVNTYSWHVSNRAPQRFSLWGAGGEEAPSMGIDGDQKTEWRLLAVVNTKALGNGRIHGSSVTGADGPLGTYRHLLWIAEDVGEGTFFTEVDVHASN
jgi:alpha-mannosidase